MPISITPIALDGNGIPLDVGRTKRTATPTPTRKPARRPQVRGRTAA